MSLWILVPVSEEDISYTLLFIVDNAYYMPIENAKLLMLCLELIVSVFVDMADIEQIFV